MIALSVDLGHARTGLAVSDKSGFLASSLCVITEYNDEKMIKKIAEKVKETKAEIIVVGLPRNMDGTEGESYLSAGNVYGKKRKQKVDAVAASIILQNYLDSQKGK